MASLDEQILRTTKEIIVKLIEVGRVSPSGFKETFKNVYTTVHNTVKGTAGKEESQDKEQDKEKV